MGEFLIVIQINLSNVMGFQDQLFDVLELGDIKSNIDIFVIIAGIVVECNFLVFLVHVNSLSSMNLLQRF
jgi:hypothetical protein